MTTRISQDKLNSLVTKEDYKAFKEEMKMDMRSVIEESMKESMATFTAELKEIKKENEMIKTDMNSMKANMAKMQEDIKLLTLENNHNNQYSRKGHLRILGIPDDGNNISEKCIEQVVIAVNKNMDGDCHLKEDDIEVAHRLPNLKHQEDKPRPMIVLFLSRKVRDNLLRKRKALKGKPLVIMEDLSPGNRSLLWRAKQHADSKDVWAHNGKVWATRLSDNRKIQLDILDNLDDKLRN
ncbi:unnamed protein product [Owenia fusiformis]|uniref:Uncharacterized protein n=1 Tax=Owenia fusiformis TaxID=6347 RepID=A0A8J1TD16_OWEFU|nr:unnamed protein product [Owenia fusiformis]